MNSKFVIPILVAAALSLILIYRPSQKEDSSNPNIAAPGALTLSERSFDFGEIKMSGGNVTRSFTISNDSVEDVKIEKITTSCMCTIAYLSGGAERKGPFGMPGHGGPTKAADEVIRAGERREIEVVFDPNAHGPAGIGSIDRSVYIEDSLGRVSEYRFRGLVTP